MFVIKIIFISHICRLLSDYDVIAAKELCIEKLQMKCSELKDAFHESDLVCSSGQVLSNWNCFVIIELWLI